MPDPAPTLALVPGGATGAAAPATAYAPDGRPLAYPPDAVLQVEDVAAWLGCSPRHVYRLPIKRSKLSAQKTVIVAKYVYAYLDSVARVAA